MTRGDDMGGVDARMSTTGGDDLDPALRQAFAAAFESELPLEAEARHLWQLYRSARPPVIDGLAAAPRPGRLRRVLSGVALATVVTLLPSVLTVASASALPGDLLYGVKRQQQLAQVESAISWEERDAALAALAELRLHEARVVVASRPHAAAQVVADVSAALDDLEHSRLPTGALQAWRMRDAALQQVAALLDDVAGADRSGLQLAYDELSSGSSPDPTVAQSGTLPSVPDVGVGTAPARDDAAVDRDRGGAVLDERLEDRRLLARAPGGVTPDAGPDPAPVDPVEPTLRAEGPRPTEASGSPTEASDSVAAPAGAGSSRPAAARPDASAVPPPVEAPRPTDSPAEEPDPEPESSPELAPKPEPAPAIDPKASEPAARPPWRKPGRDVVRWPSTRPSDSKLPAAGPIPEADASADTAHADVSTERDTAKAVRRAVPAPQAAESSPAPGPTPTPEPTATPGPTATPEPTETPDATEVP